jgi:murein DD-endopeptidase MepM/ murein hydrolase activator NlpD
MMKLNLPNIPEAPMKYFLLLLLVAGAPVTGVVIAQSTGSAEMVVVTNERMENAFAIVAHNKNPHSVTLSLKVTGKNFRADKPLPLKTVLMAGEKRRLLTIRIADTTRSFAFNNSYTWFAGDIHAIHDDSYIYRLPYEDGEAYAVGQSYNGSFSHRDRSAYAVDFVMPEGTRIVAARDGVVTQIREDSNRGGNSYSYRDDSNYIVVEHSDGTLGEYAHLQKGGVLVQPGDKVQRGQVIGLSGNTGYSSGPHLHFMVSKVLPDGRSRSLPVRFQTADGVYRILRKGERYVALQK